MAELEGSNPLVVTRQDGVKLPEPKSKLEQDVEELRQARRTVGVITSRDGNFSLDPDQQLMLVGAASAPLTGVGVFLGLDGADYEFRAGDPAGDYVHWDGTSLTVVGSLSVGAGGDVGGWTVTATTIESGNVTLDSSAERILVGAATAPLTGAGIFLGLDGAAYEFRVGDPAGEYLHWDGANLDLTGEIIGTSNIVGGAITTALLADLAVTAAKIDNLTITTGKLVDLSVTEAKVAALAITETKIGNNSVSTGKIQANAVTAAEIAAGTITATEIAAGTITANEIASNTITAAEIAALTITAAEIAAGTITAAKLNVSTLSAISANLGTVTAGTIQASVVVASESFTASDPVFDGIVNVNSGHGSLPMHVLDVSTDDALYTLAHRPGAGVTAFGFLRATASGARGILRLSATYADTGVPGTSGTVDLLEASTDISGNGLVDVLVDLDLNSNDLLNVGAVGATSLDAGVGITGESGELRAMMHGSTVWNPGSIGSGADTTTTVTVTGAVAGDRVLVALATNPGSTNWADFIVWGYATSANTVTLSARNMSSTTTNPGSGTFHVYVIPA